MGIDLNACVIGDRWQVGTTLLEVAQPRLPCFKLALRMGDDSFTDTFEEAGRLGVYLRIITGGVIEAGDSIGVDPAVQPATSIAALLSGELDDDELRRVIDDPRVPAVWQRSALRALRG